MSVAGIVRTVILLGAASAAAARGEVLRGRVVDSDGRPVSGAAVSAFAPRTPERRLLDETRGDKPRPAAETKTDAGGAFTVRLDAGLLEGARLRVEPPGLPAVELDRLDESDAAEDLELMLS